MNGKTILANLKRLRDVHTAKDIPQLTHAVFPGTHCPLMGAMMAVRGIKDAVLLVVGTDECTYYTKNTTIGSEAFGGLDGRCFSVVLDQHDVTFGCKEKLDEAVEELMEEVRPKTVFVVTTCVIEVIGDDVDSMAEAYREAYNVPFLVVHTEHFKTENHLPGVQDTITACIDIMEETEKTESINIIGQRLGDFSTTELCRILKESGCKIGMMLPSGCTVEEIRQAAGAKVNVVVNAIGLPLAKKMKRHFGTPYVFFDKFITPQRIREAYEGLFGYLELSLPSEVDSLYARAAAVVEEAKEGLFGIGYIYGNTPLQVFEFNAFMLSLGMKPLLIQTAELPDAEDPDLRYILDGSDPYVTKTANIAPLQYVYDVLSPHLYLGHEFAVRLREKGIELVHMDSMSGKLGFEITVATVEELLRAAGEARRLHERRTAI